MTGFRLAETRKRLTAEFPLVDDHPDVAGVLRDRELLPLVAKALAAPFVDADIDAVLAPEARGPILGALVAVELGAGLVLARKQDRNHPGADIPVRTKPTWQNEPEVFQNRSFDLRQGDRVLLVDDWITTGNSLRAALAITRVLGATVVGCAVLVNKADRATLEELDVHWLVDFDELMSR